MTNSDNATGHGADHTAGEQAKPEANHVAALVNPVTPHAHAVESRSLAELLGISHPSPSLADGASVQVAENEKTHVEREMERRGATGGGGNSGDQSSLERARILPVEQQLERER